MKNKIKVTRHAPQNINVSWTSTYTVVPLDGQSQAEAEAKWQKICRECGEFAETLLRDGESDIY